MCPIRGGLQLLALLLSLAACGGDGPDGPAGLSSSGSGAVAYTVTRCRQTGADMTLEQEVRVVSGEAEDVLISSVGPLGLFRSFACANYGFTNSRFRPDIGPLQRFGITPDGSGVAFELSDEFLESGQGGGLLPAAQHGIYYARADGGGVRRLGPPSRAPVVFGGGFLDSNLYFDPSGQRFTYTDRGPDEAGREATQVFVQGLAPGERSRQVTRLPALDFPGGFPERSWPIFWDAHTIGFFRWITPGTQYGAMLVNADGTNVRELSTVALPGGVAVPVFSITGGRRGAAVFLLPGGHTEVFIVDGANTLQLTNFGRPDTSNFGPFYSARDGRVYFTASVDPFGTNPSQFCQIFSIDPLGRDLRQLTFFHAGAARAPYGCLSPWPSGCRVDFNGVSAQNPHTGTIFFGSNCDPLGHGFYGWQIFSMQPDGSELLQLTEARGYTAGNDGFEFESADNYLNAPYQF